MQPKILGKAVTIQIDRPLGSRHPDNPDMVYPINYGYVRGVLGGDGEEQDVYLLGVNEPVEEYTGIVIAVIQRLGGWDLEDKWVAAPENIYFSKEEILKATRFQEKYFESDIYCLEPPAPEESGQEDPVFSYVYSRFVEYAERYKGTEDVDEENHIITDEEAVLQKQDPSYFVKRRLFVTHHRLEAESFSFLEELETLDRYAATEHIVNYPIYPFLREDYHIIALFDRCVQDASEEYIPVGEREPQVFSHEEYSSNNDFSLNLLLTRPEEKQYRCQFELMMNPND